MPNPMYDVNQIGNAFNIFSNANSVSGNNFGWIVIMAFGLVGYLKNSNLGMKRATMLGGTWALFCALFMVLFGVAGIQWIFYAVMVIILGWVVFGADQ